MNSDMNKSNDPSGYAVPGSAGVNKLEKKNLFSNFKLKLLGGNEIIISYKCKKYIII